MILDEILAHKRQEVAERKVTRPQAELEATIAAQSRVTVDRQRSPASSAPVRAAEPRGPSEEHSRLASSSPSRAEPRSDAQRWSAPGGRFGRALRQPGVSVIAEIKRRSPSGGELRPGASSAELAATYAANGAAALSVLTDLRYFGGTDADLVEARAASSLPVLRKDFVVDAYQVYEAAALGADAVLLIVRALTDTELSSLLTLAERLDVDALVEAHSATEVQRALDGGAQIVGVNNRDLDTLVTDVTLAERLRPLVPAHCVFVAESGLSHPDQMIGLADAGIHAALIGETLVRAPDPGARLRDFITAAAPVLRTAGRISG